MNPTENKYFNDYIRRAKTGFADEPAQVSPQNTANGTSYYGTAITPGDQASIQAQMTAIDAARGGSTPIPITTPTAKEPTIGETYKYTQNAGDKATQQGLDIYGNRAKTKIDENAIRRNMMQMFQKEIDATNQIYAGQLAEQQLTGQGRLGSQRAGAARGGLLGSDFGAAQAEKVGQYNTQERGLIQSEQSATVAAIMGKGRQAAVDEIKAKREALASDVDTYLKYVGESETRKKANLSGLAARLLEDGIDIKTLAPEDLAELAKSYGASENDIVSSYSTTKTEKETAAREQEYQTAQTNKLNADIANGRLISIGDGTMLYNVSTGETIENPKSSETNLYGGYNDDQNKKISSIDTAISKNDTYKKTGSMRSYADNVLISLSQGTGTGDLAAINQFQKVIDEGAVTRDQDVKLIQQSQSLYNSLLTKKDKLIGGQQLSPELRNQMKTTVEQIYQAQISALNKDPFINSKTKELQRYGIDPTDTILGELGAYSSGDVTGGSQGGLSPDLQQKADQMRQDGIPDAVIEQVLGQPISFNSVGNTSASIFKQAIVKQESGGSYTAVNKDSGAMGKYQIMPANMPVLLGMADTPANRQKFINNPVLQDKAFDRLISELGSTYNNDPKKMLAAYYGGPNAAKIVGTKAGDRPQGKYPSINQYVAQVLAKTQNG